MHDQASFTTFGSWHAMHCTRSIIRRVRSTPSPSHRWAMTFCLSSASLYTFARQQSPLWQWPHVTYNLNYEHEHRCLPRGFGWRCSQSRNGRTVLDFARERSHLAHEANNAIAATQSLARANTCAIQNMAVVWLYSIKSPTWRIGLAMVLVPVTKSW